MVRKRIKLHKTPPPTEERLKKAFYRHWTSLNRYGILFYICGLNLREEGGSASLGSEDLAALYLAGLVAEASDVETAWNEVKPFVDKEYRIMEVVKMVSTNQNCLD